MREIRVGYRTFRIEHFPDGFGERLDGQTDFDRGVINLSAGLTAQARSCVILHEILHIIWDQAALQDGDTEERIVTAMANGLSQVLRDNDSLPHEIVSWLRV